ESFYEAWDRFNDLLRACPHHGFSELHRLDTFYNALNTTDQDSLNSATGGNFLNKMPRECLKIIESKSRVRQSRSKAVVAKNRGNNYDQNRGNNFNQGPIYQIPINQPPIYQAPVYQALALQAPGVSKADFESYVKANDVVIRNVQTQGQTMQNQLTNLMDMLSKFVNANTASSSGPTIPSSSYSTPPKVVNRETEDMVLPTNNRGTEVINPPVVQNSEPIVAPVSAPMPNQKTSIMFPSRINNERRRKKANEQIEKVYEIFRDLSLEISFMDALTLDIC
nr:reverse transcriptase domain-containing protein [Tanacetum cinerariifolium]